MSHGACIPIRVHTVVVSIQHSEEVTTLKIQQDIIEKVIKVVIPSNFLDENTVYHIQPSGRFVIGGPQVSNFFNSYIVINIVINIINNFIKSLFLTIFLKMRR